MLNLLLNLTVHAFLSEANDYQNHYDDCDDQVYDCNDHIDSIVKIGKLLVPSVGK